MTVEDVRRFGRWTSWIIVAASTGPAVLVPIGLRLGPTMASISIMVGLGLAFHAGFTRAAAYYRSDADIRRRFGIDPPRGTRGTSAGIEAAVLRCKGVTRALVFGDRTIAVYAEGGDEAEVRRAISDVVPAGVETVVHVDCAGSLQMRGR